MGKKTGFKWKILEVNEAITVMTVFIALGVVLCSHQANATQSAVVATVAADYSSGAHSVVSVDPVGGPRDVQNNLLPTISDITIAAYGRYFYRIERFQADNVTKFDIASPSTPIWQFSTLAPGEVDSNPQDLIFVNAAKAYLLRYGTDKVWVVDPAATSQAEFKIGELDLSPYADQDGIPEMVSGVAANGKLFITLQRIDENDGWNPKNTPYLAVFDTATDSEIDTGVPNEDDVLGVPLPIKNPSAIQYLADNNTVYVQGLGRFENTWFGTPAEYAGGIVSVDPESYSVKMILDDGNDSNHPYGNINGMAVVSPVKGYFVAYKGWGDNLLYSFDPSSGAVTGEVAGFAHKSIAGLESGIYVDNNNMLWVSNQTDARVDILNTVNDTIDESVSTGLNPQKVVFCDSEQMQPVLDVKANGQDGPLTLSAGASVSITVDLTTGGGTGQNADWWIVARTPGGVFSYVLSSGWQAGVIRCLQTPLFDLSQPVNVLHTNLGMGNYTFYFAVDDNADGKLDATWQDSVKVNVR